MPQDKQIYSFENLLHNANEKILQPENTYRDLYNSYIIQVGDNQYAWRPMAGNVSVGYDFPEGFAPVGIIKITEDKFGLFLLDDSGNEKICRITEAASELFYEVVYESTLLGFDFSKPIEGRGYLISNDEIWIHWVQAGQQPRVMNIGVDNTGIDPDMFNYTPKVKWPTFDDHTEIDGDLLHGTYFPFVQYIGDNNVRTDFSPISAPLQITGEDTGYIITDYQNYTGEDADRTTGKGLRLKITNIDTDYNKIRVGFFYSNGREVYSNGVIAAEESTASYIIVDITSMLGFDTVLLSDVVIYNAMIQEARAIEFINNYNALGRIKMKEELPLESSIDAYISPSKYELLADITGITESFDYPLFGMGQTEATVYPGIWYRVKDTSAVGASFTGTFHAIIKGVQRKTSSSSNIILEEIHKEADSSYNGEFIAIEYMSSNGERAVHETTVSTYTNATNVVVLADTVPGSLVSHIGYHIEHSVTDPSYSIGDEFIFTEMITVDNIPTEHVEPILKIKKYYNYDTGNQIYDIDTLDFDWQDYKSTMIAEKCSTYKALDKVGLAVVFFNHQGKPFYARDLGIIQFPDIGVDNQLLQGYEYSAANDYYSRYNHIVNNIVLNNIDITDIKDDVQGMLIVRTPVNRLIKSEGILHPFYLYNSVVDKFMLLNNFTCFGLTTYPIPDEDNGFAPNIYAYKSPELLFGLDGSEIDDGSDKIEIAGYLQADYPAYSGSTDTVPSFGWENRGLLENDKNQGFFYKMYRYASRESANANGDIGNSKKILANREISEKEKVELFYTRDLGWDFHNITKFEEGTAFWGAGARSQIIRTDGVDPAGDPMNDLRSTKPKVPHVRVLSSSVISERDIGPVSTRRYISTGRYIPIDATMLSKIENGGDYIIDGVEVYGGDCFNSLFDFVMWYPDEDVAGASEFGHNIVMPIVSEINIAMRHGKHIAKDRTYRDTLLTPEGLRFKEDSYNFEQYLYNTGYSSREIEDTYPALPIDYENDKLGHLSYIWSEKKSFSDALDSYRIFKTANRVTLEPKVEFISALSSIGDYLVAFTPNHIYYIPVGQRVLFSQGEGYEVQLGAGTEFIQNDSRSSMFGCSDKFTILKLDNGLIFYDNRRKTICEMTGSGSRAYITSLLDLRPHMLEKTKHIASGGSPYNVEGFIMSYDILSDLILFTIIDTPAGTSRQTIQYHRGKKRIVGFDQRNFVIGVSTDKDFFTIPGKAGADTTISRKIYLEHVRGITTLYGAQFEAYIHIVLNKNSIEDKIFDGYELLYENYPPIEMDVITKAGKKTIYWATDSLHTAGRNTSVKKRDSIWGPFPSFTRQRTRGKYIELLLKTTENLKEPVLSGIIIKTRKAP